MYFCKSQLCFYYEHYNYAYLADQDIRLEMAEIYTTCDRIHEYLQAWRMGERKNVNFRQKLFFGKVLCINEVWPMGMYLIKNELFKKLAILVVKMCNSLV